MTGAGPPKQIAAVVDRVRSGAVPIADFIAAYDETRSIEKMSPRFAALAAGRTEEEAVEAALLRAADDGFYVALLIALLDRGQKRSTDVQPLASVAKSAIADSAAQPIGTMQRMLSLASTRPIESLFHIQNAGRASGLIKIGNVPDSQKKSAGTGFLVSPTLLLTAAHVIESLVENGKQRPGSEDQAIVEFHNRLQAPQGVWPVRVRFAPQWLVCMSPPNGSNGRIDLTPAEEAGKKLDFALIELSEPAGDITGVVDIAEPPDPQAPGRLAVIGYTGGTACAFDDRELEEFDAAACRLRHLSNTEAGMSGGPCLDVEGRVIGVHEGAIDTAQPPYNRAVNLRSIRTSMLQKGEDPLSGVVGPIRGLSDREARKAWVAAGETLIGTTPDLRQQWLDSVVQFNPDDPRAGASPDVFHPVFGRQVLHKWVSAAAAAGAESRIALITGLSGTGKSFTGFILKHRLRAPRHRVALIPPMLARKPLADIAAFLLQQAGAVSAVLESTQGPPLRPPAGILRRDVFPETFSQLATLVRPPSNPNGVLWIFADLGDDATLDDDTITAWKQFLAEAEKQAFVRLSIAGIGIAHRGVFRAAASKPELVKTESLTALTRAEMSEWIGAQAEALRVDRDDWVEEAENLWDESVEPVGAPQGRSVLAVRLVLQLRSLMQKAAEVTHGG
jgi:V8-like Glu-specific endopeptidase